MATTKITLVAMEGRGGKDEGGGNSAPIAVTPHRMIRGGVTLSNKPVYWDSSEAAKLIYETILQHSNEELSADQVFKIRNKCVFLIRVGSEQYSLEKRLLSRSGGSD